MRLWTYATVKRAEYDPHRRVRLHCKRHECCPVEFNLAIVYNCTTQPDGCRLGDCIITALGKKRKISLGELPGDWNPADRRLWQFKQLRKSRAINEESGFARDRVDTDYESVAPSAADHLGKIERRERWKPAKFGCLLVPKRDRQFGVAKFAGQLGFWSPGIGHTITIGMGASGR